MIVAVAVEPDGTVGHSWGKATAVAVATVVDGQVRDWSEFTVGWDQSHAQSAHGAHHARVVTFLREHQVQIVVVRHIGDPMRRMLSKMDLTVREEASGDARLAAVAACAGTTSP